MKDLIIPPKERLNVDSMATENYTEILSMQAQKSVPDLQCRGPVFIDRYLSGKEGVSVMSYLKRCLYASIVVVLYVICCAAPVTAEQAPYQVTKTLWALMDGNNQTRAMDITAGLEIEGLWGPVPEDDAAHKYLIETFDPAEERYAKSDTGPFIRVSGYQSRGRQVSIKVNCPTPDELGTLRNSDADTYSFFRPTTRLIRFRFIRNDDFNSNDFEKQISLEKDETNGTISWIPAETEYNGRVPTAAPVILEIAVWYQGFSGLVVGGNPDAGWEKKTHKELRIGWLVMPVCGNEFGDHMVRCPAEMGPFADWRNRTLNELSLFVPDNWYEDLSPEKDQGRWRMDFSDPPTAELLLARVDNTDEWIREMELKKQEDIVINGIEAKWYEGRLPRKNVDAVLCILTPKDTKGRTILLAAVAADWNRDGSLPEASLKSFAMNSEAVMPSISADPTGPTCGPLVVSSIPEPAQNHGPQPEHVEHDASRDESPPRDELAQTAEDKLNPDEQEALAQKLFQQMVDTPEEELETFERLYKEVMEKCPDTERAEISYWRLSNLYLMGYEPPKLEEIVTLLERFVERYPESEGIPQIKERLLSVYERTERWCKAADIYGEVMPEPAAEPDPERAAIYGSYAEDLEKCGRTDEALTWYRTVLDASRGEDTLWARAANEALVRLGAASEPEASGAQSVTSDAVSGPEEVKVRLIRKTGVADFVGRNEALRVDGSADSRFILEIRAPERVVTGLAITSTSGQSSAWDTTPENKVWLVAVAKKNTALNQPDGSVRLSLPEGAQIYDLWVQDNNSIVGGKTRYNLRVTFEDGSFLDAPVEDER